MGNILYLQLLLEMIQTAFSCSSAMEKWKFQSRRNYKLHARVKGAGYELVLRNGISTTAIADIPLVRAPFFVGQSGHYV